MVRQSRGLPNGEVPLRPTWLAVRPAAQPRRRSSGNKTSIFLLACHLHFRSFLWPSKVSLGALIGRPFTITLLSVCANVQLWNIPARGSTPFYRSQASCLSTVEVIQPGVSSWLSTHVASLHSGSRTPRSTWCRLEGPRVHSVPMFKYKTLDANAAWLVFFLLLQAFLLSWLWQFDRPVLHSFPFFFFYSWWWLSVSIPYIPFSERVYCLNKEVENKLSLKQSCVIHSATKVLCSLSFIIASIFGRPLFRSIVGSGPLWMKPYPPI